MKNINTDNLNQLNVDFLNEFPLESLKDMSLEQYTNTNRSDSFCYWLETKTRSLGGIGGGSSFKFGIYKCKDKPKEGKIAYRYDGKYAWRYSLGKTAVEAFKKVKKVIVRAARFGKNGDLDAIESITGNVIDSHVKWKIAFLYSKETIIPYYGHERLKDIGKKMGMPNANKATIASIQKYLISKRDGKDIHEYGKLLDELYKNYEKNSNLPKLTKNYWLAGCHYGGNESQFDRFITEGIWEGKFYEKSDSGQNLLAEAKTISQDDIIILKSTAIKGTNKDLPFLRVKAIGIVTGDILTFDNGDNITRCQCSVKYLNTDEKDFNGAAYGSYRKTIHRADSRVKEIIDYVNELITPLLKPQPPKYREYIELLLEAHNLVLTGAPGTGKTYMAKAITKEMGAEPEFVQFHPSYDYTDFVEGLRPIEKGDGQMGFERKDGVFKQFCKKAAKNIEDSQKSAIELKEEKSLEDKYNELVEKIENDEIQEIPLKTEGMSMEIVRISENNNVVLRTSGKTEGREYIVSFDRLAKLAKVYPNEKSLNAITNIHKAVTAAIRGCHSSSYWAVLNEVYRQGESAPGVMPSKIERKSFVFIIDEINRGEASKIFGELFFAIDPGYRGKTDILVKTQYQNLVPETDVFADGFYVPENVYILATMNDIDRSVESMDFAMRRRFTWHEITPNDTESMLDTLACADEAKETMHRLNAAIAETDGLGAAYMIGPAYFLKLEKNGSDFEKLWKMNILPLLKEYLRGFRKTDEILDKFSKAYFGKNDTASGNPLLEDEN